MTNRIKKTYKFRLYPTIEQEKQLLWTLEQCRFVYNFMLNWYKKTENVNKYVLQNSLPKLKEEYPRTKECIFKGITI